MYHKLKEDIKVKGLELSNLLKRERELVDNLGLDLYSPVTGQILITNSKKMEDRRWEVNTKEGTEERREKQTLQSKGVDRSSIFYLQGQIRRNFNVQGIPSLKLQLNC